MRMAKMTRMCRWIGPLGTTLLAGLLLAGAAHAAPALPCEPSPEVEAALAVLYDSPDLRLSEPQRAEARAALFERARARFPNDPFVEQMRISFERPEDAQGRERFAAPYLQRATANPSDPVAAYLAAQALMEWRTGQAIPLLERAVAAAPGYAAAHASLADVLAKPAWAQPARAGRHRRAALRGCPALALDFLDDLTPAELRSLERLLVGRLEADPVRYLLAGPRTWELGFRTVRPREFPRVRARIRRQLARLHAAGAAAHPYLPQALIHGWKLVNDRVRLRQAEDDLIRQAAHSQEAQQIVAARWDAEHPTPGAHAAEVTRRDHQAHLLVSSAGWIRSWPASDWAWDQRLEAVLGEGAKAAALVAPTIDGVLRAARDNPEAFRGEWPLPLVLAERLVARGEYLDRVPQAIEAGKLLVEASFATDGNSDYYDQPDPDERRQRRAELFWPVWRLMASAAVGRRRSDDARLAAAQMSAALPHLEGKQGPIASYRVELAEAQVKISQLSGQPDPTAQAELRRWRERQASSKPALAGPTWQTQRRPLPAFRLDALDGKRWSLAGLRDKVVFINVWSRACGPCLREFPALNQLQRRLAGRKDAVLLSVNIDTDVGNLPPFLADEGVEFPVLLGEAWIEKALPQVSIPRNWVIDRQGVLRAEQLGYDARVSAEAWVASAVAQIDELAHEAAMRPAVR
jgi:thiol-disulfide isomerase/thioredoxin